MKTLLKNGNVVNVFTGEILKHDILIEDGKILSVSENINLPCDEVKDLSGLFVCPGFIDGHIHIESSMLTPFEFTKVALAHGTTAIVADPHEIANVSGIDGINYMLEASEGLPLTIYFMLPSCVPSTPHDEAGAILNASDLLPLYEKERVLGLGEMMNYPGVLLKNEDVMQKLSDAKTLGKIINGHAPLLSGEALDNYIFEGIADDHECSSFEEAKERIRKGQKVMIRQGSAAKNLKALLPLFEAPWNENCMLVSDDKNPADLLSIGHLDGTIKDAVSLGASPIESIRMATIRPAKHFGLKNVGAIAPGYFADLVVFDNFESFSIKEVYKKGKMVSQNGIVLEINEPPVSKNLIDKVYHSFNMPKLTAESFEIPITGKKNCRVIEVIKGELLTNEAIMEIDFNISGGIDAKRDILKCAVAERHHNTGHIGVGFITGLNFTGGAIASSVSHDSHNLIIVGSSEEDMAKAGNRIRELGGGLVVVKNGEIIAEFPLPVGGVMTDASAQTAAEQNEKVIKGVRELGVPQDVEPFMTTAFMSLAVIPHLKMTTKGLIDVNTQTLVDLVI